MRFASLWRRACLTLLAVAAFVVASRPARAEPPSARTVPVYVLSLWTDDADDQADALTQALRSRVRQAQGWSLLESPQSFETLAIALKCPNKPDAPCLQRIGDQIHADHYVWGTMAKKKGGGEVTADVHLWSRGKGEVDASETFTDNLKDASDEALRQIAGRLFGRLVGTGPAGTVIVRAGTGGGSVLIDGSEKAQLEGGVTHIDIPGGEHTIRVRVPGFEPTSQQAMVVVGQEHELTFTLTTAPPPPVETAPRSSFPTRTVLGVGAIVAGVGLLVASGVEAAAWQSDNNQSKQDRAQVPSSVTDVCTTQVNSYAYDACRKSQDALTVSKLAWVFGGAGVALLGTGVIVLVTGPAGKPAPKDTGSTATKPSVAVTPAVGPRSGFVDLRVTF
jgi:hypothetical protein